MTENTPGSLHRRTVVAGAAWTIPVVATAIGAPLAAASTTAPQTSDIAITYLAASSNNGAVAYFGPDGAPGWGQNTGMILDLRLGNFGPGTATSASVDVFFYSPTYANGSASIVAGDGWTISAPENGVGGFAVVHLTYVGSLAPGGEARVILGYGTPAFIPSETKITNLTAYLVAADPADPNANNNSNTASPHYWVRQF
ncbi:hypothetical protein [Rathayibacter sp. VKM Ac-2630]|uniref:hypothetical protein n=1 Tax=Rathayibacter sp. VKM Ac-2630 TaxID=1938617 RepID=UPI000980E187|nr:hypothetical protein [Rathayibacter sp. VKM Ac-2630]OOB89640.1 hypothetical protein B0T42_16305 [Rathayibacter sp. VKM Ac-2630]